MKQLNSILRFIATFLVVSNTLYAAYYRTVEVRREITSYLDESNRILNHVKTDLLSKQELYTTIMSYVSNRNLKPYPRLGTIFNSMEMSMFLLRDKTMFLELLNTKFEKLAKRTRWFDSNGPEWKKVKKIKTDFYDTVKEMQELLQGYTNSSHLFIVTMNDSKITKVKIARVKKKVVVYLQNLDKKIIKISQEIVKSRRYIQYAKNRQVPTRDLLEKETILGKLETIKNNVMYKRIAISNLLESFELESDNQPEIWTGPGMRTLSILEDIKIIGNDIDQLGARFDKMAQQL